jgi:hypothetical protein
MLFGIFLILLLKLFIRPYLHTEAWLRFPLGVAPNFLASFFMPFGAYWLYTHARFFNGVLLRFPFFSDVRIVCAFGFVLIVINEYFQLMPVLGRTFDYFDILFSAFGYVCSFYAFSSLQRRHLFMSYDRQ